MKLYWRLNEEEKAERKRQARKELTRNVLYTLGAVILCYFALLSFSLMCIALAPAPIK
jgi:hypothetical protein